jgi:subfamily B ATP-binding cassette protein MsbA
MDDVISQGHWELLPTLAMAAGTATLVDAGTAFANSQVLGVAAQRAITEMRKDIEAHVMRLPIRYFDSTKSGILISRIMTDAEGIRNLVGTGLVQLTGSILTAAIAMCVLLYLNWKLTAGHRPDSRRVRRRHGDRLQAFAAALPGARPDQR